MGSSEYAEGMQMSSSETPWEYLPTGDADVSDPSPEEAAMHVEADQPVDLSDAADSDFDTDPEPGSDGTDDDDSLSDREVADADELDETELDDEPDVQDLLELQGYSFGDSSDDAATVEMRSDWVHNLEAERLRLVSLRDAVDHELPLGESQRDVDGEFSSADQHPADAASMTLEREVEHSLVRSIDRELDEVDDALQRVEAGTYGRCQVCHGPIGDSRLRAEPATRFCITHQRGLGAAAEPT